MERMFIKLSILWVVIALTQVHGNNGCLEKERIALLEIKAFFKSVSNWHKHRILASWVDDKMSDCCGWKRVKCNAVTGRVIELSLNETRQFKYENFTITGVYPVLYLSLFRHFDELQSLDLSINYFQGWDENKDDFGDLKQLKILDLSGNWLNNSLSPYVSRLTSLRTLILRNTGWENNIKSLQGILDNLKNLEILDLSRNEMSGYPTCLGLANLRNLKALDLSDNYKINCSLSTLGICELKNLVELKLSENEIHGHLPHCLSNLTRLKFLDLSSNQLSGNFSSIIATFTSLKYLSLSYNNFEDLFSFNSLTNLSKLEVFLLSTKNNMLTVETETQVPTLQLKALTLANCNLHGSIPDFILQQYNLQYIDLSHNKLVGNFPTWLLQNNTKLQSLSLKNNSFSGILQLPNSTHDLIYLDISNNNLTGQISKNMGKILYGLQVLDISENDFEGNIPSSMGEMKSLDTLDLSSNNFSGELPHYFITGCFSLTNLLLSDNNFQGKILPKFMNWTYLRVLFLDNNQFSGELEDGLLRATGLVGLDISNNKIYGQIPLWIGNLSRLNSLFMSENLLEGNNIIQLGNLERLYILNISENRLSGPITSSFNVSSIVHLYMQNNAFNGSIPSSLFKSSDLTILDLSSNEFSGSIPQGIDKRSNLEIILLRGNHLQGYIPHQLCQLRKLGILDLSYNRFNGSIPSCLTNMLFWTRGIENDNEYNPTSIYFWWEMSDSIINVDCNSTLDFTMYENSHKFQNKPPEVELVTKNRHDLYKGNILDYMTGLDLSSNELSGDIPLEIGDLQGLHALNLSNNSLSGSIPKSFSNLKEIESLDLSYNKLVGQIPPQLTELYNLAIFNVSYNNLSGSVPSTWQFGSFEESSYVGNPHLCGPQIKKMCTNTTPSSNEEEEDDSAIDMVTFYWSFVASYVTIIMVLVAILWMNSYWRRLWFCFVDKCISLVF